MLLSNVDAETVVPVPYVPEASNGVIPYKVVGGDPFAIFWANTYRANIQYDTSTGRYIANTSQDMALCKESLIEDLYAVSITAYWNLDYFKLDSDGTTAEKEDRIKNMVCNLLSANPEGICLYFNIDNTSQHMLLLTGASYEADVDEYGPNQQTFTTEEPLSINIGSRSIYYGSIGFSDGDKFTVYDPASKDYAGENVLLSNSYTNANFSWLTLQYIAVLD